MASTAGPASAQCTEAGAFSLTAHLELDTEASITWEQLGELQPGRRAPKPGQGASQALRAPNWSHGVPQIGTRVALATGSLGSPWARLFS